MVPWDVHADLTEERLSAVARLIARGRNDALESNNTSIGDNGWTLGSCAFQYGRYRIREAAQSLGFEWLKIIDGSLRFIFAIGRIPVRFYRGLADEPNDRTKSQSFNDLRQLSFDFDKDIEISDEKFYRFAVETDDDGSIMAIKFIVFDEFSPPYVIWEVPLGVKVPTIFSVVSDVDEGVELPPPVVGLPGEDANDLSSAS